MKFGFEIDATFNKIATVKTIFNDKCEVGFSFSCEQVLNKQVVSFLLRNTGLKEIVRREAVEFTRGVKEELKQQLLQIRMNANKDHVKMWNGSIYVEKAQYVKGHGSIVYFTITISDNTLDFETMLDTIRIAEVLC